MQIQETALISNPKLAAKPNTRVTFMRILALMVVLSISIFIFSIRDQVQELAKFGYPGIFLLSILANSTILLPAPGILFVFTLGAVFNPIGVAISAGLGAAIGELTGYLAGFSGQAVVENYDSYERIRNWMESHKKLRNLSILVLAFIPNPFFDLAGIAAGTMKIPVLQFLVFCSIGKILKMLAIAYAGASSFHWLIGK
jgi:membrane protein YqaA with SNARE-associated domain